MYQSSLSPSPITYIDESTQASPSPSPSAPLSPSSTFYLIHMNIILYAFFYWFNQPVLPYLSKELGVNPLHFGYFQSFNQFIMLIGTIFIGKWIDKRGAKVPLILSHVAGATSYYLLFKSRCISDLFISQLPTLLMSGM